MGMCETRKLQASARAVAALDALDADSANEDDIYIDTRELCHRIAYELKQYSIPQAVFADKILGRSQGTLSDLLRNPKPWNKLKSGRETFRRMYNWLKLSVDQRMNILELYKDANGVWFECVFLMSPSDAEDLAKTVVKKEKKSSVVEEVAALGTLDDVPLDEDLSHRHADVGGSRSPCSSSLSPNSDMHNAIKRCALVRTCL
jgi:hypothetical protein